MQVSNALCFRVVLRWTAGENVLVLRVVERQVSVQCRAASSDPQRLQQIVWNLVSNAMKFTPQDGSIDLELADSGPTVCIRVTDSGVGIAPENLTRIFQHGFTTKKRGHGFGLHSAALAAKEIGGSLCARSDGAGAGATFTLSLPIAPSPISP